MNNIKELENYKIETSLDDVNEEELNANTDNSNNDNNDNDNLDKIASQAIDEHLVSK